jgi:hypothetical protein
MILTETQRRAYVPPPCPRCGATPDVHWFDVSAYGDQERSYLPDHRALCPTLNCVGEDGNGLVPLDRCRTCRRPVGDVHTAACADMVLAKIDRPCYVSTEDCW